MVMNTITGTKTAMITGASKGIGLELTKILIQEGWEIIALIRSDFPTEEEEIQQKIVEKKIRIYRADLSNYQELKVALNKIKMEEKKVDVLFNNAGGSFEKLYYSVQSREMHFEVQTVVPFIILMEMKELLKNGINKTVVNTSTNAFKFTKNFSYEELIKPTSFKKLTGAYTTSKLALSLWSQEISQELKHEDIKILCVDPGGNNTIRKDKDSGLPFLVKLMMKWFFSHPSKGATLLYKSIKETPSNLTGVYISNGKVKPLKFTELSKQILDGVNSIYHKEYLK